MIRAVLVLSLALGGAEVELLEHTDAYGIFSQEGVYHPYAAILEVDDKDGKVLQQWQPQATNRPGSKRGPRNHRRFVRQ